MTAKRWYILAALVAAAGLLLASVAFFSGSFSPRGYVEASYDRAAERDIGDEAEAHVSAHSPDVVAAEITEEWEPAARHADASGVYLRYADDAIVIVPLATGSLILVEKVSSAYRRYHSHVAGLWGWTGRAPDHRGGGPGSGK
jgi:hypothetical protein